MSNILFSPIKINSVTAKNRILFPGMSTKHSSPDGHSTERLIRYYEERAKGGAAVITVEASYVLQEGRGFTRGLSISRDSDIESLSKITERIHKHGALASIQLMHAGYASLPEYAGRIGLVSSIPGVTPYNDSYVFSTEDIMFIIESFAKAAERAQKAGFDMIELHGAHGYLLMQFFSPLLNKRTDKYGGSLENRIRFSVDILKAVRSKLGKDYPIIYRMSAIDGMPNGITIEDSKVLAQYLVENGVDALHISVGTRETRHIVAPPSCVAAGWNASIARAIKTAINSAVPVIVVGRINNENVALDIIEREDADMVAMGRALIAEPHFPNLVKENKTEEILRCVGCNDGCSNGSALGIGIACALNPLAGLEGNYDLTPSKTPKTVCIVGAGPAGINAAFAAYQKGHTVHLLEKKDKIGGILHFAKRSPYKELYEEYVNWSWHRLRKMAETSRMNIHLSHTASVETVGGLNADVILLATGSYPAIPPFCSNIPNVCTAQDILVKHTDFPKESLILGGGLVGCETADFLLKHNCKAAIVERQSQLAKDMEPRTKVFMLERLLKNPALTVYTDTNFEKVDEKGNIHILHAVKGEIVLPPADALILALGCRSEQSLYVPLAKAGYSVRLVGDCNKVGKIWHAVKAGFEAGLSV